MGNRLWLAPHFFCCLSEYIVFGRIYGSVALFRFALCARHLLR